MSDRDKGSELNKGRQPQGGMEKLAGYNPPPVDDVVKPPHSAASTSPQIEEGREEGKNLGSSYEE